MKEVKAIKTTIAEDKSKNILAENSFFHGDLKKTTALKEFTYNDFKKIADKVLFTLAE